MKKLLLTMLGLLLSLPAIARDFEYTYEGQTITYTVIDEDAKTCKTKDGESGKAGNTILGDLTLPFNPIDRSTTFTLTELGNNAFSACANLNSIYIPESVNYIGEWAFYNCLRLTSISIPNAVTYIGDYAFLNCSGLTKAEFASIEHFCSIKIGNFYSNPLYYAHTLYINGEEVKEVTIPEAVTSIGDYAFYN
ncbi:MAG: leucine-rich repeat domain-containing protein, partial [Muribaculaceae bacterium]|nr:leucine-rich repeat domain-containing protein [Muribaculaceae bacterium]